ncbi:MAG: hypothetical protein HY782_01335 [Chloroflexi bacterium]|nr:hypothetical protein [Chloroflexota bacterium]
MKSNPRALLVGATFVAVVSLTFLALPTSAAVAGCPLFPANNVWNTRVDTLPVDSRSATYVNFIGASRGLHPDFGSQLWDGGPIGIPYATVAGTQPRVPVTFYYPDESDPGPYPIPSNPPIEYGSDHHLLIVDRDACQLFELYDVSNSGGNWSAGSGAIFDLNSNALRPAGWTSADAAGLPMLPGLARYDEVASGVITHALRFTVRATNGQYIWPARHRTSSPFNSNAPPMGQRFRLKASYIIPPTFSAQTRVLLTALKTYGMFVSDNGSDWYFSGAPDPGWDDDALVNELRLVTGSNFEAVDESRLMRDANSGQAQWDSAGIPRLWLPFVMR